MTTVAYKDGILAADTRQIGDYIDQHHATKIYEIGSAKIGFCGSVSQALIFIKWFKDQTRDKPHYEQLKNFEALVIRGGRAYAYDGNCEAVATGHPCAIGSGCHFAMGAMLAGASAVEAVKIAMKLDENTGGKVKSIIIK